MKKSKGLFAVIVVVLFAVMGAYAGSGQWSNANVQSPTVCRGGTQNVVNYAISTTAVATACNANLSRVDGFLLNTSTNYLWLSYAVSTSTSTPIPSPSQIDAAHFLLYATGDSYGRDRMWLSHDNHVQQGAIYFTGWDTLTSSHAVGSISFNEWK